MRYEHYELTPTLNSLAFEFISEGKKGSFYKKIEFTETSKQGVFNLAFGDKNQAGEIDDLVVTNNGDTQKVLTTVVRAVFTFFETYPKFWVFVKGSTPARTRMYQIGISLNLEEAEESFYVLGFHNGKWDFFEKNKNYEAFLIKKKIER